MPGLTIIRGVVVEVITGCTYADGQVAIVALKSLGFIGSIRTAIATYVPVLSAVLTHEEIEVLAIVGLTVDKT